MALHKVLGIETEYGIVARGGAESNPVSASSLLINAYLAELEQERHLGPKVGWDFEDETPGNDARGPSGPSSPPDVETHLVNAVLTNDSHYLNPEDFYAHNVMLCINTGRLMTDPNRWKLVGLETVDGSTLPDGAYAVGEGTNENGQRNMIGRVTSTYHSPTLSKGIAMGLVLHGPDRMGEVLSFPGTDGKTYEAKVVLTVKGIALEHVVTGKIEGA